MASTSANVISALVLLSMGGAGFFLMSDSNAMYCPITGEGVVAHGGRGERGIVYADYAQTEAVECRNAYVWGDWHDCASWEAATGTTCDKAGQRICERTRSELGGKTWCYY